MDAIPVIVPRLGWSMEEGTFVEWLKHAGDLVRPGDPLFTLETEKATESVEALDTGQLHIPTEGPRPGDRVLVGQVIGYVVPEGAAVPVAGELRRLSEGAVAKPPSGMQVVPGPTAKHHRNAVSPRARRVARDLGVDWNALQGTGHHGRIRERDIRMAATTLAPGRLISHTHIRRLIAARMVAGVTQAAPVTLTTRADATNLVDARKQARAAASDGAGPSYTAMILKVTAAALQRHPLLQAQWREDGLFVPEGIHIAIAVDTEAGLLAPVIRDVDKLTAQEIAHQSRELIALARTRRLSVQQMTGATFTITNLGMFGIDAFTPIIHLPECAALGIGRILREPAVIDDRIVPRDMLTLSLTFDHRVVDGAPAARFLDEVRRGIESLIV